MPLKIIFMGTPEFAVPSLRAVSAAGHSVVAAYTQPPRPSGRRGLRPVPSPVQREAERLGIQVRTPISLKSDDEQSAFGAVGADVAVVVAYGLLLPAGVLAGTRLGALNAHASLLPRWRGAAPIQRAVMAGDRETGVMVMKMEEGLDTGPVALTRRVAIGALDTAGDVHDRLSMLAGPLLVEALARLEAGTLVLEPQRSEGLTYASKIDKRESRVDWTLPAIEVHNRIRGLSPAPCAWCEMTAAGRTERIRLLRSAPCFGTGHPGEIIDDRLTIACGEGAVALRELQRAGGKPVNAEEFLRGARIGKGDSLA